MDYVVGGIVLAVIAAVAVKVLAGGAANARFTVTVHGEGPDGISVRGNVPGYSHGEVVEFVASLDLPAGCKFWAVNDDNRIRLNFSSTVPEELHQRLRNFFYAGV